MIIQRSTPTGLAVALDTLKDALRVGHDDHDDDLERLIRSETARYESFSGRVMLPTEFRLSLAGWSFPAELTRAPVREVTAVSYFDGDHAAQALDEDDWFVTNAVPFSSVGLVSGFGSPALSDRPWPVQIHFSAGYDDPAVSGGSEDAELAPRREDADAIIHMVGVAYDQGDVMTFDQMRAKFGSRRIFA